MPTNLEFISDDLESSRSSSICNIHSAKSYVLARCLHIVQPAPFLSSLSPPSPFSPSCVHIFVTQSRPQCCIPGLRFSFRSCQIRWFGSYGQSKRLQPNFVSQRKDTCPAQVIVAVQTEKYLPESRRWKTADERISYVLRSVLDNF